ncbi:hypothetical protein BCY88_23100 [Paraburkholderia fungorum]|uniref:Uncharacterized protein n=2 Tax=Paraburkholderia fungorum TaxID=134537 RepID=A0A3R7HQ73_9BURK|nr:hypothetical protein BCY88_23100 [Paraburkholderia fungorum]
MRKRRSTFLKILWLRLADPQIVAAAQLEVRTSNEMLETTEAADQIRIERLHGMMREHENAATGSMKNASARAAPPEE